MNRTYNNNTKIASIVVIALLIAIIGCLTYALGTSVNSNNAVANADTEYTNGVVADGYVSSYKSIAGSLAISNETQLFDWLTDTSATEEEPLYGYLTKDIECTRNTISNSVKYHYLDGCGFKIEITSASGSITSGNNKGIEDPIIAEDASFSNSTFNYLDCNQTGTGGSGNNNWGDADGIITT